MERSRPARRGKAPGQRDPALNETLLMLDLAGEAPSDVRLVGNVAKDTDGGVGLTQDVRKAVPAACTAVIQELARIGLRPEKKAAPAGANLWWEAA